MDPIKRLLFICVLAILAGCASDPLMSGKPQDWVGHPVSELRSVWGEPNRILPSSKGGEVWEYQKGKDYVIPRGENLRGGFGGGAGGFSMEKRIDDQAAHEEQIFRFKVKSGVVSEWYASRTVNGRVVWEDH